MNIIEIIKFWRILFIPLSSSSKCFEEYSKRKRKFCIKLLNVRSFFFWFIARKVSIELRTCTMIRFLFSFLKNSQQNGKWVAWLMYGIMLAISDIFNKLKSFIFPCAYSTWTQILHLLKSYTICTWNHGIHPSWTTSTAIFNIVKLVNWMDFRRNFNVHPLTSIYDETSRCFSQRIICFSIIFNSYRSPFSRKLLMFMFNVQCSYRFHLQSTSKCTYSITKHYAWNCFQLMN